MCRRVHLRAHRASRQACLGHACLPACLRHTCLREAACHATIVSSHVVSAHVKRAAPLVPRRHHPACLPVRDMRCDMRCDLDSANPRDSSNLRHCDPVTLCDSAPTPSVLRRRRPTRMACHLSPPTRGSTLSVLPHPLMLGRKRLPKLSNTKVGAKPSPQHDCPRSHRTLSVPAALACTCTRACPCTSAPPLHAPIHVVNVTPHAAALRTLTLYSSAN